MQGNREKKKLAVIGPHADSLRYPVSGYTYPAYIEMLDSQRKNKGEASFHGIMDEQEKAEREEKKPKGPCESVFEQMEENGLQKLKDMNGILREYHARSLKEVLEERYQVM